MIFHVIPRRAPKVPDVGIRFLASRNAVRGTDCHGSNDPRNDVKDVTFRLNCRGAAPSTPLILENVTLPGESGCVKNIDHPRAHLPEAKRYKKSV